MQNTENSAHSKPIALDCALAALPAGAHQLSRAGRFKMAQDIKRSFSRAAIITALHTAIKLRDPYWMMVYRAALVIGR